MEKHFRYDVNIRVLDVLLILEASAFFMKVLL